MQTRAGTAGNFEDVLPRAIFRRPDVAVYHSLELFLRDFGARQLSEVEEVFAGHRRQGLDCVREGYSCIIER